MFILATGKAEVQVEREGRSQPVGSLAAGDCFGEISLLTGEPRSATVLATLDCEVLEIEQETIGILLREHPELAESLSETVVARRSATETQLASAPANGDGPRNGRHKGRPSAPAQEILPIVARPVPDDGKRVWNLFRIFSWSPAEVDERLYAAGLVPGPKRPGKNESKPSRRGGAGARRRRFYRPAGIGAREVRMRKSKL